MAQLSRAITRSSIVAFLILVLTARPTSRVVILGDSITYGAGGQGRDYVTLLREKLGPEYEVVRIGLPGGCSWNGLWVEEAVRALRPDILVIYFGDNDVKKIHSGAATWQRFQESMERLASLSNHTLIIIPFRGQENPEQDYYLEDVAKVREIILTLGKPTVDLFSICCSEEELASYIHPNEAGHMLIAEEVYRALIKGELLDK